MVCKNNHLDLFSQLFSFVLSREYQSNWFWGKCGICVSVLFMWFEGVCFRVETIILEASLTTLWLCSDYQAQVNFLANPDRIQLI